MAVFNRRNAVVGWLAIFFGKRAVRRKVKNVMSWRRS